MSEPQVAPANCEHHYETHILGGHPISVRVCVFCRTPDWADLHEQAVHLYQWGRDEELASRPPREKLSAYDMPRDDAPAATPAPAPAHSCSNCEGVDPDTCVMNPDRPPEQCPNSEFDGYGEQCQKPAGHNLCSFEERPPALAHDAGPSVAEAKADDRRWWGGEKTGEQ